MKYDQDSGKLEKTDAVAIGTYETIAHAKGLISQKTVKVKVRNDLDLGAKFAQLIFLYSHILDSSRRSKWHRS